MSATFDILEYISGLTGFKFDDSVITRIAFERGVANVTSFNSLTQETKDLLKADLLYTAYCSPDTMASQSVGHSGFSKSVGQQIIKDKERIYNIFMDIYRKYSDPKIAEVESGNGTLQWLDC